MKFVRWKRYGFTHIVRDEEHEQLTPWHYKGGTTVCGNWWQDFVFQGDYGRYVKGLLAPSETDDEARPLCGLCKKYLSKHSAERN